MDRIDRCSGRKEIIVTTPADRGGFIFAHRLVSGG